MSSSQQDPVNLRFAFGDQTYEIDLSHEEAKACEAAFAPYIRAARVVALPRPRQARSSG